MKKNIVIACLFVVTILFLIFFPISGCATTSNESTSESVQTKEQNVVTIEKNEFKPRTLTVKVGDTVNWINKDINPQSVVSDAGLFHSGEIATSEKFSYTFTEEGTYDYHCDIIRTFMKGKIIVEK